MQSNFFKLFGLSDDFDIDTDRLNANYKTLQKQFHPDKFAAAGAEEQRVAMQYATQINEGYTCLKNPVRRAEYLMQQRGYDSKEHTLKSDPDFLFQQMAWRDELQSATAIQQVQALQAKTRQASEHFQQAFAMAFRSEKFDDAQMAIDKLQFISKFESELQQAAARMGA